MGNAGTMHVPRWAWLAVLVAAALAPATAHGATFSVNQTSDQADVSVGNGACDWDAGTSGNQCTLRAAIEEANFGGSNDTINFSSSVFTGNVATSTITLGSVLPAISAEVTINGRNCASSGTAKPCVGVARAGGGDVLVTNPAVGGVDIRGLAVTGATAGIFLQGDAATVKGSWFGIKLDGSADPNNFGLIVRRNSAVIGGTSGADRNVFGNNGEGLFISQGADDARVRGNYFGTLANGTTAAPNGANIRVQGDAFSADEATGNVIGASVSSSAAATSKCDGGCNLIANGTADGIVLAVDSASSLGPQQTTIKGNFIGLDKSGSLSGYENSVGIDLGDADGVTIGGSSSRERNYITGGSEGISGVPGGASSIAVKRNFIGLNSAGTAAVDPPTLASLQLQSPVSGPTTISRNRIAADSTAYGLALTGQSARVVRNKFGVGVGGTNVGGGVQPIRAFVSNSVIGEPGAGNTVGNGGGHAITIESDVLGFGDSNRVQGNLIGVDSAGNTHPNLGIGIQIVATAGIADGNLIGGTSSAAENVISDSLLNAIVIASGSGNDIKRNRGKDNGGIFIDLEGAVGFGNGPGGPNGEIEAPIVDSASRTSIAGHGALAGATIYIFRTTSPAGASPPRINAFVDTAIANGSGNWSANFAQIPSGQNLTALQLDATDGSSELAKAFAP
jgi:hypothetical protein